MMRPHPNYPHINVGRKGPLVYYTRGESLCIRSYTKPRDPRSPLQRAQRNLHASLTHISGQTKEFRRFCYEGLNSYRNSHTAFIGTQLCQANRSQATSDRPLESRIRWGRGSLPGVRQMAFSWKEQPVLSWLCDKRKLTRQSDPNNRVLWIVWNAEHEAWRWSLEGGKRRDETSHLTLPDEWKEEELYIWLLFYDASKRRFSTDSCLHVKRGENNVSCRIDSPTLYADQGYSFYTLVDHWTMLRTLRGWDQQEYREKWFT